MTPFTRTRPEICPKCDQHALWEDRYREPSSHYGDGSVGDHDWFYPEHLEVVCRNCGYSYEMETADSKVPA